MTDQPATEPTEHRPNAVVMLLAICAIIGAVVLYGKEHGHGNSPNYAPALLFLGIGAFLILLMVIQANGNRDR